MRGMLSRCRFAPWVAIAVVAMGCRPAPDANARGVAAQEAPPVQTQERTIDWDEARGHERLDDGLLSEQSIGALRGSTIPALLPHEQSLVENAVVTTGPSWFSASMHGDGYSVVIHGSNRGVRLPDDVNELSLT